MRVSNHFGKATTYVNTNGTGEVVGRRCSHVLSHFLFERAQIFALHLNRARCGCELVAENTNRARTFE
jgi:hypothetical protein